MQIDEEYGSKKSSAGESKSNFGKYLALYLAKFQEEKYGSLEEGPKLDVFWPFKFVWYLLTSIWFGIFGERR